VSAVSGWLDHGDRKVFFLKSSCALDTHMRSALDTIDELSDVFTTCRKTIEPFREQL